MRYLSESGRRLPWISHSSRLDGQSRWPHHPRRASTAFLIDPDICTAGGTEQAKAVMSKCGDLTDYTISLHENEIKNVYLLRCFRTTDIQKAFSFLFHERIWTIRVLKGTKV